VKPGRARHVGGHHLLPGKLCIVFCMNRHHIKPAQPATPRPGEKTDSRKFLIENEREVVGVGGGVTQHVLESGIYTKTERLVQTQVRISPRIYANLKQQTSIKMRN
jgi:hypothetical protein